MSVHPQRVDGSIQPTLGDYWDAVYRKRWLIVLVMLASGVLTFLLSELVTPRYEATAEFYVPQDVSAPAAGPEQGILRLPGVPDMAKVYGGLLESGGLLRTVAERVPGTDASSLGRDVDVVVSSAGTIRLYARNPDPEVAAKIVSEWIEAFRGYQSRAARSDLERSIQAIDARLERLKAQKMSIQEARVNYVQRNGVASAASALGRLRRERYVEESDRTEASIGRALAKIDGLRAELLGLSDAVMITESADVPRSPVYPIVPLNVAVGLFAGLVAGLLYALMLDYGARRRQALRAAELVRTEWGQRLLAALTAREDTT